MDCKKRDADSHHTVDNEPPAKHSRFEDNEECEVDSKEGLMKSSSASLENEDHVSNANAASVGITEYLGSHIGFYGSIKERWEDFIVYEISEDGSIVHLTSLQLQTSCQIEVENSAAVENSNCLSDEIREKVTGFLASNDTCLRLPASDDKAERGAFHAAIKQLFPMLDSSTQSGESDPNLKEYVLCRGKSQRTQTKEVQARRGPKNIKNSYCHFVLYKEGRDTMNAIHILTRMLGIKPGSITYAGTKDKRGITTQMCSVRGFDAQRLSAMNKGLRGMKLGNFKYSTEPIHLGQLQGNRFAIVIRGVTATAEVISHSVQQLQKMGFINYYGTQRFGTSSVAATYAIGAALLKKDWKGAIKLILTPCPEDMPAVRDYKERFMENLEVPSDLTKMPISIEKTLLYGVAEHGFTLNALQRLPRQTLQLYVHSVQSFVWNHVVSKRIREYSTNVLLGDLILDETSNTVKPVKEENVDQVDICDVALPLPGNDVQYPSNQQISQCYDEVLISLGLSRDSFTSNTKEFHLAGAYRNMIVKPSDVSYELRHYEDIEERLVETDLDILNNVVYSTRPEGSHQAVVLRMNLPKSVYATMAMRELMKSVRFHK